MYRKFGKRIWDIAISLLGIVALSPLLILLTLLLSLVNQGKPFFFQQRPGKNERLFTIVKFKTMNDKRDATGKLLPDMQRTTKIGAFLRKYSLDELPNLWNVLTGKMSLIGPRPLLTEYLPLYSVEQKKRHNICGGITGWAQINGRNAIRWKEKFQLDVWYVDNVSFILDVKIVLLTLQKLFRTNTVNASENVTMEWFNGHN
ncbi:MAG: sugar transferase [Dysgonamonadaceae bacterium]|jgi:lipopolysaccharide/colanic/teichoic acid biosynthesis glycosyltransferase|nr:sugar transferase [Dysgonamonadaceae bacterium]